jgi:MFS family permease
VLALSRSWPEVVVLRIVLGLLAGGAMSLAYTMGARMAPPERSGLTLSVLASCAMLGGAVSPMLAGLIGQFSLRYVFLANAVAYLIAFGLALLPSTGRAPAPDPDLAPASEA